MNRVYCLWRLLQCAAIVLALALCGTSGAAAVDLTGKSIVAKGHQIVVRSNMVKETVVWSLELYFGEAGNRFIHFKKEDAVGTTNIRDSFNRVLIEAGKDRGLKRRKDGNFTLDVRLEQSASNLQVKLLSRGKDLNFADESFIFVISLGANSCKLTQYRYNPDARLNFFRVQATPGACTLSEGAPEGLSDR